MFTTRGAGSKLSLRQNEPSAKQSSSCPGYPFVAQGEEPPAVPMDAGSKPRKLIIAIDIGTSNIKVVYLVLFESDKEDIHLLQPKSNLTKRIEEIVWEESPKCCPAQIAYYSTSLGELEQVWGWGAEDKLKAGAIEASQILRWLKVTFFNGSDEEAEAFHQGRLLDRMRTLKRQGKMPQNVTVRDLWTALLRHTYQYVIDKISADNTATAAFIKDALEQDGSRSNDSLSSAPIEVVFPVPADAYKEINKINLLQATAADAGIPSPSTIAEPIAALVETAQSLVELNRANSNEVPTAIVDTGAGSVDIMAVVIRKESTTPADHGAGGIWKVHELIPGWTRWSGGFFVDNEARQLFQDLYLQKAMENMPEDIQCAKEKILDSFQQHFEDRKRKFTGDRTKFEPITLPFDRRFPAADLPWLTVTDGSITLKYEFMEAAFEPLISATTDMLDTVISQLKGMGMKLGEIVLTGGGNENEHVRLTIVRRFESTQGYHINVERKSNKALMKTVIGAALMQLDPGFMGGKKVRRGYCFGHDPIIERKDKCRKGSTYRDKQSNVMRAKDRSAFVLSIGDTIEEGFTRRVSQVMECYMFRDIFVAQKTPNGYLVEEDLYYTDNPKYCDDNIDIKLAYKRGHLKLASSLKFFLSDEDCQDIQILLDISDKAFLRFQYDIGITVEKGHMQFFIEIPRCGVFPTTVPPADGVVEDSAKFIRKQAIVACGGIFEAVSAVDS